MPNEQQPDTVIAKRAVKRAPISPTEKISQRDNNVLKLLKVLLLLKQVLAYFTRTAVVTRPGDALTAEPPNCVVFLQSINT